MKDFIRRVVPRPLRNALRRPRRTIATLVEETTFLLGRRAAAEVRPGWTLKCHPASRRALLLHREESELRSELDSFVSRCRDGMVFFDVGAHYGVFSLAALHFGQGSRVVAIEPSKHAARILRVNLTLAHAGSRANVVEAAAGSTDGSTRMLTTGPNAEHYMVGTDEDRSDVSIIQQRTLASVASSLGVSPTHIKIDVESFEGDVIEGARDLLARERPLVFLELHGDQLRSRGRSPRAVLTQLEDLGYKTFLHEERPVDLAVAADAPIIRLVCS